MTRTTFSILPLLPFACLSAFVVHAVGCAGAAEHAAAVAADMPPPDFTLDVTVISHPSRGTPGGGAAGSGAAGGGGAVAGNGGARGAVPARELRPARFVIEADRVLRAFAARQPVSPETFPNETRQLSADETAALWRDLQAAGVFDPDHPATVGAPPTVDDVAPGAPVWVIAYAAAGDRRTIVLDADPASPAASLINRLADLAWMPK